jgi:hypothetical protein
VLARAGGYAGSDRGEGDQAFCGRTNRRLWTTLRGEELLIGAKKELGSCQYEVKRAVPTPARQW